VGLGAQLVGSLGQAVRLKERCRHARQHAAEVLGVIGRPGLEWRGGRLQRDEQVRGVREVPTVRVPGVRRELVRVDDVLEALARWTEESEARVRPLADMSRRLRESTR
jgi:hypothetical protein